MKTYIPKVDEVRKEKKWFLIDLEGKTLGRAAIEVARILSGKNKPTFTPHMDTGDFVVAVNAAKVVLTGNKAEQMKYYRYSGYQGGMHMTTFKRMMEKDPTFIFEHAVKGMVPKTRLGRKMIKKLHVYADDKHPHRAQKPIELKLS